MSFNVVFYESESGNVPAFDFIDGLRDREIAKVHGCINLLEKHGYRLCYPLVDTITGDKYRGLKELRIECVFENIRLLYFVTENNKAVILHAFKKKTQKTPTKELETALNRMKDYIRRNKK